ncbi:MBL fold metallo-hydrolase [bacterium]|nr:MBL fold metallo-hydrolase [candidate division CSSED10-310 bacterium]
MPYNSFDTVIPIERTTITRGWILTYLIIAAAGFIWIMAGFNVFSSAEDTGYTVVPVSASELEVTFLDVGEGDGCFIRTPNGHTILVDAGPGRGEYSDFDAGEQVVIPYLKSKQIKHIDTVVLTHPHADHYGGLMTVMDYASIGEFLDPGLAFPTKSYEAVLLKLESKKIPYRIVKAPSILDWDPSIFVQILWPEDGPHVPGDPNNNSIVIRLVYKDVVYLLTGDIETPVEQELYAYGEQLRTTVLKIPHHGSDSSSSRRFIEYLQPRLAIFSLGRNNRFNHPDESIVERYGEFSIPTLRTDYHGDIRTMCDGHRVKVFPEFGKSITIYPFPSEQQETE